MHLIEVFLLCVGLILVSGFQGRSTRVSVNIEPLLESIRSENLASIQRLLKDQNLNVENRRGVSPLGLAVQKNNKDIVDLLIRNGASVTYPKGILKTAVERGNDKIVELLIQNGVNVNTVDFLGESPLQLASYKALLLARTACRFEKIVEMLVKNGARVNDSDVSGKTALHQAASFGRVRVAEQLIRNGANVNQQDKEGKTPLHYAAIHGHVDLTDLLRRSGADIDIVDNRGRTALNDARANRKL